MGWKDIMTDVQSMRTLLVIPHYEDTDRLEIFLPRLASLLPGHFDILVSDDGSTTSHRQRLGALCEGIPSENGRPRVYPPLFAVKNTGKGGAIVRGWGTVSTEHGLVAFADADGAVDVHEIMRAEEHLRSGAPKTGCLFGSRIKMLGRSVERSLKRHLSGRIFATLVSMICKVPAYDTQCGLKILRREAWDAVAGDPMTEGFAFDVELLLRLLGKGVRVDEFPVDWHDVPGSKVKLMRDSWRMGRELFAIRRRVSAVSAN